MGEPKSSEELLQRYGMEGVQRYYGPYRGVVTRVDDPEERGRIQAYVRRTMGEGRLDVWIDPMEPSGEDRGWFWPPDLDDHVWVFFDNGAPHRPVCYLGGWHTSGSGLRPVPAEFAYQKSGSTVVRPDRRGFITRGGHQFIFDDTPGAEQVALRWHQPAASPNASDSTTADRSGGKTSQLLFAKDGGISLATADGVVVDMKGNGDLELKDKSGNSLKMTASGIVLESVGSLRLKGVSVVVDGSSIALGEGATSPAVKGDVLVTNHSTHAHLDTAPGTPTSPPIVPLVPSVLSGVVRIK